jgi:uncharacterized cupredoxin-like copper-binding protein
MHVDIVGDELRRRAQMKSKSTRAATLALALSLASGLSIAHGNNDHARHAAPIQKEQQPWGIAGDLKEASRTIEVAMTDDMRFTPSTIDVRQGETVRFVVTNKGKVLHEMVMGTRQSLDDHAALMQKFPGMQHDEPHMAHVAAGRRGELVWKFNRAGTFDFACLLPGHYQAGMAGRIKVKAAGIAP